MVRGIKVLSMAILLAACGRNGTPAEQPADEAEAELRLAQSALDASERPAHGRHLNRYLERVEERVEQWQRILDEGTGSAEDLSEIRSALEQARRQAEALEAAPDDEWEAAAEQMETELSAMEDGMATYEARYIDVEGQ